MDIALQCATAYQSIVTMESSRQYEKDARKIGGFPWRALGWSLGAHVLILLALVPVVPQGESGVPPAQRLLAHLRSTPSQTDAVLPASTFPLPARAAKSISSPVLAAPTQSAATEASQPAPLPAATGGEPVVSVAPTPSVAMPSPAESAVPDAAGLRQYRLALATEARRYRRYPEAARRAGLAGTVEVRINVTGSGLSPQAELTRSSGHAQLDMAAVEMLRLAAERTALPEALRHRQFVVLLPVVFEVEE